MTTARGFWSYVHKDDEAQGGRIAQLARDVVAQYEMITGESIELFLDQDRLQWGDNWREKVDESLASVAFFIPVLTPRYFQSVECRRELNHFVRRARRLGLEELIMPVLYVDFPGIRQDPPSDDAVELVKPFHWEDWTNLRYVSRDAEAYLVAVGRMAERLAAATVLADQTNIAEKALALLEEEADDAPGEIDLMGQAESVMPEWSETVTQIGKEIVNIGNLMQDATAEMNAANANPKGFAARLTVLRQTASKLKGPAENIRTFGEQFTKQLNDVDQGMAVMIRRVGIEASTGPDEKTNACKFFASIREMAESSETGLGSLKQMIDTIQPIEAMSRDLRPPLKTLRSGLTAMYEGRDVISSWVALIDATGVECEGAA
jgi:hypothetical protein